VVRGDQLLSDPPPAAEVTGRGTPAAMVGFGAWLAGRFVPLAQRRRVHTEVERYLEWAAHEFRNDAAMQRPAVWCYLLKRQREGCGDAEALRLWGALELVPLLCDSHQASQPS